LKECGHYPKRFFVSTAEPPPLRMTDEPVRMTDEQVEGGMRAARTEKEREHDQHT
jgi:hypothetical protein